jgi:hypothetical protein
MMGNGLKPLMTSQRPSDSSHPKIGAVAITARTGTTWSPRNHPQLQAEHLVIGPQRPRVGLLTDLQRRLRRAGDDAIVGFSACTQ